MDVRIGVTNSPKELAIEMADDASPATVKTEITKHLEKGAMIWLTDRKGRQFGIPTDKVAYVEIGTGDTSRIGFGSS